jgi:hypothetical protein
MKLTTPDKPAAAAKRAATGSILAAFDPATVSERARRESRNREVHLPPLGTFRWWARRTGAVNEAVLAAASKVLGRERLDILDPFAGGGTIPLVALRAGHSVYTQDLNPWAAEGVRRMLSLPDPVALASAYDVLAVLARPLLEEAYATETSTGEPASVAHTYRVAVGRCGECGHEHRQFPYSLITLLHRKERQRPEAFLACVNGHVFEGRADKRCACPHCRSQVDPTALYTPRRVVTCPACGAQERLSERASRPGWRWEVVLVERAGAGGREFSLPTDHEIELAETTEFALPTVREIEQAETGWQPSRELGTIPDGAETRVLLRHGFEDWKDLYPARQRAVTEALLILAAEASDDEDTVAALRMAIVGTTEFAGHLSRWDRFYLKCNDGTAGHRFNFSTFVPEINVWGVRAMGRGTFTRRIKAMEKAAHWLSEHVEDPHFEVACGDSAEIDVESGRFDLALTDPPYHDDVHYGELSLPFRAWAELPVADLKGEASSNTATKVNTDRESYADSLERIFRETFRVLRADGRLIFSYANHEPEAWVALFSALQHSGFHAVGCVAVHAENETDFKKRDVNSCNDDILLELTTMPPDRPCFLPADVEDPFLNAVMKLFSQVGALAGEWEQGALTQLKQAREARSSSRASDD